MNQKDLWQTVLAELELQISKPNFVTWLKHSQLMDIKEGTAMVGLPNNFAKEWVENKYHKIILGTLRSLDVNIKQIDYIVSFDSLVKQGRQVKKQIEGLSNAQPSFQEFKVDPETNLNPRYILNSFVVGPSNELAYAAASAVIKDVGRKYNPLFIYGGVGLGKTHLLQAIGNEIKQIYKNKIKVKYVTSEKFLSDVVAGIRNKRMEDIKEKYRLCDVLIIDDIQFIGGKEKTEEEFFHTFNTLYENNKQIVISSDRPPRSIPTLEERLRSRFEGGMIADIGYPGFEMRVAIIKTKLQEQSLTLNDDIVNLIASKIQRNIRELEGTLNRLLFEQSGRNEITIKRAEEIINQNTKIIHKNINPKRVIQMVAEFFELPEKNLIDHCRKKEIVLPRQIAMYLLREELNFSYPSIGEKLGSRDHTTVIHACNKISKNILEDRSLENKINLIKERIYS